MRIAPPPLIIQAAERADWTQVVQNGGPPCFHLEEDRFCLRAERWEGHADPDVGDDELYHRFVSLGDLLSFDRDLIFVELRRVVCGH